MKRGNGFSRRGRSLVMAALAPAAVAVGVLGVVVALPYGDARDQTGYATTNVILVVIDGVRATEAFEYPGNPSPHPNIPRLWGQLRPQGTLLTNMRNMAYTKTASDLATLMTGRWHYGPNVGLADDPAGFRDARTLFPTIIEQDRRDAGAPPEAVAYYSSKDNGRAVDFGWNPPYGSAYGPGHYVFLSPRDYPFHDGGVFLDGTNPDDRVFDDFVDLTEFAPDRGPEDYPSLIFFHLGVTDNAGHTGNYELYLDALRNADDIVGEIWEHVSTHPHYADTTTLIVTTNHGRHDPEHGDFQSHTGGCLGCRTVFGLFLGPDTPEGLEVNRRTYPSDIAPTIARLLGFPMPWATGRVVWEAIGEDPAAVRTDSLSDSAMTAAGDEVFVTYRQTVDGRVDIAARKGTVTASSVVFDAPVVLTESIGGPDFLGRHPTLAFARGGLLDVAWIQYRVVDDRWQGWLASSADGGTTFQPPERFKTATLEDSQGQGYRVPVFPHLVESTRRHTIVLPYYAGGRGDEILLLDSNDGFAGDPVERLVEPARERSAYFRDVDSVTDDTRDWTGIVYSRSELKVGSAPPIANWEVLFQPILRPEGVPTSSSDSASPQYRGSAQSVRLTHNDTPSLQPSLALDPGDPQHLAVVWTDSDSDNGRMQLFLRTSLDRGAFWSEPIQLTTSATGAWEPSIAFDAAGVLHVAYVDFDTGAGDVYSLSVDAGGGVSTPQVVSATPELSRRPHLALTATQGGVVVWEEASASLAAAKLP